MIAIHPRNVFETMGELETAVLESAQRLLAIFERILNSSEVLHRLPLDLTRSLPVALFEYLRHFRAWKVPDEARLVARIKHALRALLDAKKQLPADEPMDSQLNTEFRTQITRLRGKLQQIAGAAVLADFDRENGLAAAAHIDSLAAQGRAAALSDRMTNEQLAHELLLDPAFQLTDRGTCCESDGARRVRESFHAAFWASLATDLRMSCFVRVMRVLVEVRDGLVEVAPASYAAQAAEVLDMDLIKQQVDAGLCTWENCQALVASVVALIRRAQSPKRDDETAKRWAALAQEAAEASDKPVVLCRGLEFLLDRVNAMRIDAANARLRLIAPVVRDHGISYERDKFQEKIDAGTLTLERTKAWLKPDGVSSPNDVFVCSLIGLVTSGDLLDVGNCPETLLMDMKRICKLQDEFVHVARSAALVARSVSLGPRVARIGAALASNHDMLNAVETTLGADMTQAMRTAVEQSSSDNDAVYLLMRNRLSVAIRNGSLTGFHDSVVPMVLELAVKVNRLIRINRAVHGATYERILCAQ
jgi:hypothetical protein